MTPLPTVTITELRSAYLKQALATHARDHENVLMTAMDALAWPLVLSGAACAVVFPLVVVGNAATGKGEREL